MKKNLMYISGIFVIASLASVFIFGVNLGPAFTGGASVDVTYTQQVDQSAIESAAAILEQKEIRKTESGYLIKSQFISEVDRVALFGELDKAGTGFVVRQFSTFGPSISAELIKKAIIALVIASILIIIFVSFAFNRVSRPVSSWKYGVISLIALLHDSIIPVGIFSWIAFLGAEVDVLFVMALLATIGYSVNDTLVIFDRVRDNLENNNSSMSFEECVDRGVRQSYRRSIFTSITTSIPLFLLFLLVPTIKWFALALFFGVVVGTFSSLFLAPGLLLLWHKKYPEADKSKETMSATDKAQEKLMDQLKTNDF